MRVNHFTHILTNHTHPSIFKTIEVLLKIQVETHYKCNSFQTPYTFQNSHSKKKHEYVKSRINQFNNNQISRFEFVKSVSCYYHF